MRNVAAVSEIFIDTTPGTPQCYRQEVWAKIINTGYRIEDNIFFGTDHLAGNYDVKRAQSWIEFDTEILRDLPVSETFMHKYSAENFMRFLSGEQVEK